MKKINLYPKIETLFNRDPKTFKVIEGVLRWKEFRLVNSWTVTEKIHGMNVHIRYEYDELTFWGRTNKAQLPKPLMEYFNNTFTLELLRTVFPPTEEGCVNVRIFGEAYGPRIQKGGGNYRDDVSIRVFDVWISDEENPLGGWWLEYENIKDIATKLGIKTVPIIAKNYPTNEIVDLVKLNLPSKVAQEEGNDEHRMEGVVARSEPLLSQGREDG